MTVTLITGANRGIGLEHVRQSLAAGESVIAACRNPDGASVLDALKAKFPEHLTIEQLDVSEDTSVAALAAKLKGRPIDALINNAGIFGTGAFAAGAPGQSLDGMEYDVWQRVMDINLFGAMRVTSAFKRNLEAGSRRVIVMMTSDLASISGNSMGGAHAYRTSKAALNMLARGLARDLGDDGFTVIALSPGWTQTDMGGEEGIYTTPDSVSGQRKVIADLSSADNGKFFDLTGKEVAW